MRGGAQTALLALAVASCGRLDFVASVPADTGSGGNPDAQLIDAPARPIAFIQSTAGTGGAAATYSLAYGNAVSAGSLLVIGIDYDAPAPLAPVMLSDSLGAAYRLTGPYDNGANHQYIAYGVAPAGGIETVTVALAGGASSSYLEVRVHEYRGSWSANPLDTAAGAPGVSPAVDGATTPPLTTTAPNELLFALFTFGGSGIEGTGFTRRTSFAGDVTEDRITGAPGSYRGVATMQSGTSWTGCAAAFINGP